ncbi:MAG: hypothetical protein P8Y23_01565 [Candidatus Lokiarchaeota archaeon]
MVENKKELEIKISSIDQNRHLHTNKREENIKMSLIYAFLFDVILIVICICFICLFYIVGGIFLNPLLIFITLVIILLFALIETMNLVEKDLSCKKKGRVKSHG